MLSFTKLITLALILVAVWYGFRLFARWKVQRDRTLNARRQEQAGARRPRQIAAEDMAACPVCGVYVPAAGAARCGRPDCPQ